MENQAYQNFVEYVQKITDLNYATALLHWDKEVNLPEQSVASRSRQLATLTGLVHQMFTSSKMEDLLGELESGLKDLSEDQMINFRLVKKDYLRAVRFDEAFVMRRTNAISKAYHDWIAARQANDFKLFQAALEDLIQIKREEAHILGFEEHPYDALLDEFEPGYSSAQLDRLFTDVRNQLVDFAGAIREQQQVDDSFLYQAYPEDTQWKFSLELLDKLGYNFKKGRQDKSPHPFTINFGPDDVRVTTIIDPNNFANMCWSCIHELGHALYEQGLPITQYGMPLGRAISLGIHESQSRLYENNLGRSMAFCKGFYPMIEQYFPEQLKGVDEQAFFKGINKVIPSPIRIESDELHYHFHIMIRYEIEKALIEDSLQVKDIPEIWNNKYKSYLGLDIQDDNTGCLQDIHWSHGSIGYFPTYSLGSFYAAQFYAQAEKEIDGLEDKVASGETSLLLKWLRNQIHEHGQRYTADELCQKITGESLNFSYFMDYAKKKYTLIYS